MYTLLYWALLFFIDCIITMIILLYLIPYLYLHISLSSTLFFPSIVILPYKLFTEYFYYLCTSDVNAKLFLCCFQLRFQYDVSQVSQRVLFNVRVYSIPRKGPQDKEDVRAFKSTKIATPAAYSEYWSAFIS